MSVPPNGLQDRARVSRSFDDADLVTLAHRRRRVDASSGRNTPTVEQYKM